MDSIDIRHTNDTSAECAYPDVNGRVKDKQRSKVDWASVKLVEPQRDEAEANAARAA